MSSKTSQSLAEKTQVFIHKANAIGPMIAEYKNAIARGPDLPEEIVAVLKRDGLTRLWFPESMGGPELPPTNYLQVIEAIARHDGSAGWCASIASTGGLVAGLIPADKAQEMFGEEGFSCGSIAPAGIVEKTELGWRVKGKWPFSSFIRYSAATLGLCVEHEKGAPRATQEGGPVFRIVIVPTSSVRILSTWNGSGLRSSGTHDFEIDNVVIDDSQTIQLKHFSAKPYENGSLYKLPFVTMFAIGISGVSLGLARGAIEAMIALAQKKIPEGMKTTLSERASVQLKIAEAETLLQSARAFLFNSVQDFWDTQENGTPPSMKQRAMVRMASCNVVHVGKVVTDMMFSAAGGHAVYEDQPFAAYARDAQAVAQHRAFSSNHMETAGRILMGLDAGTSRY